MKRIDLLAMKIANFKGIKYLEADFGDRVCVTGSNGSGKTSVYDAYLWCLFEKNAAGEAIAVQPLNVDNSPVHKVETSVEVAIKVTEQDGTSNVVTIKRTQNEKWVKPRGLQEEVFDGLKTERYFNDVPCKVSDFATKMNEICDTGDWFMLSSISAFMGMKMEDRRKKLQSIAHIPTDMEMASEFPHVLEALKAGKSIEDYKIQIRTEKSRMKAELDEIPIRIDQQEKLRVDYDFDALEKDAKSIQEKIAAIEASLTAMVSNADIDRASNLRTELAAINKDIVDVEDEVKRTRSSRVSEFEAKVNKCNVEISSANAQIEQCYKRLGSARDLHKEKLEKFEAKKAAWLEENKRQFVDTTEEVCPTCNRPLPYDEVMAAKEKAVQAFNARHNELLDELYADSVRLNQEVMDAENAIKKEEGTIEGLKRQIKGIEELRSTAEEAIKKVPSVELTLSAKVEYTKLMEKRGEIERQIRIQSAPTSTDQEKEAKKASLRSEKDELNAQLKEVNIKLGSRGVNAQIDAQKKALDEKSRELAQKIASHEQIEFEIMEYKKLKISLTEDSVSQFFDIVHWKMFEQNTSNDGEKELCDPITEGKPYSTQNTAMQFNMAVDIINGMSKGLDILVPMFIDQKESVSNLLPTAAQLITLEVKADQPLDISIIKN